MPSLDEYRARYDDLRSLSDADAIQQIAKVNGVDVGDVTSYLNYEPPGGDFLRQLKNSWTQTKQLGAGLGAAAAATAETSFGEGGLATGLKKAAVEKYKEIGNELQINSKASDSLSYSWEEAHKGNFGALVDWTQGAFGMGIGQIGQAIGTAGVGGIIGRTVGKKVVEGALSEMVEKEAKRLVLNNVAEDEAKKQAVGNVASRIGQNAAIGAQVLGMEGGEIGGDLAARATEEGRILTGAEIARALAATVVAAGPEAITERWALDAMTGKLPWLKAMEEASGVKGKTARAGMIGAAGATIGAGQEFTQTYIEEAGKGNEINNQTLRMAIDAAGMGAVGGAIPGAVGGLVTRPNEPAAQAPAEEAPPKPRGQVTLAEIEQMRTQRLAQLDQEERGHEGGVVTNPEGGIDVIAPRIGRELSPQEKGERLFLTTRPPEAIARRYGLEIAKPDDAEIAAPIIAAQDEDQAIAEFEKAATANVPAIESQKVDILGDAGREAEQALPNITVPELAPVDIEQPAVAQALAVPEPLAVEGVSAPQAQDVAAEDAPKTAMQIAFERAQQRSASTEPVVATDQAQAAQPAAIAVAAPQTTQQTVQQAATQEAPQPAPIEQRNPTRQERIAQMTPADIEQELYVSRATGIKNRRALDEDMQEGKKAVTFIDLDGLKYINDTFGHEKGNELLKKFADAMTAAGIDGYHISGDEFGKLSDNVVKAKRAIKALEAEASKARIESDTDILHGITFSYGIGKDLATADANMQKMKASREQAGLRVRGGRPPNLVARLAPPSQPAPQQAPTTPVQRGRRLQPFTDNRLSDPEARLTLQAMADAAGWAQVGGLLTRDSEGNVGRTKWIPRADWFGDIQADKGSKLTGNLKGLATRVAVRKALSGEPMTEAQKRHVVAMLEWKSQEQLDYEAQNTGSIDPFTLLMAAEDVGIDHGESLSDEALAARALEMDEEAVNRAMAASEYESEFLDEMRRIVDGEAQRQGEDQAIGGGSESVPGAEAGAANQEGFSLTSQTEAQRVAEEARKKAEKAAKDKADAEAEVRARVDREARNFELGAPTNQSDLQEQEIRQKADEAEARAKAEELGVAYPVRSRKESSDRWIEVQTGRKAPDEHQQKIMDAAQAARDAGITTLRETERFIDSRLPGYFPEDLGRGNGSSMASEVSFALRALDMLGASRREKDAASRLDLRPGQKVGDITINTGRKLRAAQVESIEDGEYVVVGTAGGKKYRTRLTADGLERAVQRASEEGSETDQPAQDDRFYYTTGLLGMTSSGSFTEDKSRWVTFPRDEAQSFDERNLKPAYATKRGIFTGVTTGRKLAPKPKPVTPQVPPPREAQIEVRQSQAAGEGAAPDSPTAEPTGGQKIEDFGEVLEGARKHYAAEWAERMREVADSEIGAAPLSKSWPEPDYARLLEGGADPWAVAFVHAARDEVPSKPGQAWKLKRWVEQVATLRKVSGDLLSGEVSADKTRAMLHGPKYQILADAIGSRIDLYQAVGHAKSLKGVRIASGTYSMLDGVEYKPPRVVWMVERKAKASAFSNWPTQLAKGDTREEAIAAFKKAYGSLDTQPKAEKQVSFSIYYYRSNPGQAVIGKKVGRGYIDLKTFDSRQEARDYLAGHQSELEALLEKRKEIPNHRKESNAPRVGIDHRNGADVTPEQFAETFGFRGVQFGNYVEGPRRQQDLNRAYDALLDMAGVLELPPSAMSLNGELGLAFGARGTGGKLAPAAHYEPKTIVINLTKREGAGSLAHEWWHALDNYFSRARGQRGEYMTERPDGGDGVRTEMREVFRLAHSTVMKSALRERSQRLDKKRTKAYWSTGREMTARAFESFIIEKLRDQGQSNDYLANIVSEEYWKAATALGMGESDTYPYPEAAEIPQVRAAFEQLFRTVETRETDRGTLLYSRGQDTINVDGVDRPTQNSNGQRIHPTEEGIRNFWRFFGDSAVVDDQGRPLVVYHGTRGSFNAFEMNRPARRAVMFDEREVESQGAFFSEDEADAREYGRNVMPVYLSVQNPFTDPADVEASSRDPASVQRAQRAWEDAEYILQPLIYDDAQGRRLIDYNNGISATEVDPDGEWVGKLFVDGKIDWDVLDSPDVVARMKERGYDGARVNEPNDDSGTSWFVVRPEQIKSAIGNTGEFSPSDARIHKSVGEGRQGEHTVASVTSAIEARLGKGVLSKIADQFRIVPDMAALKSDMEKRGSKFVELVASKEGFLTKGLYDPSTDTSYIVAGNLNVEDSPYGIFLHEVGEHYGLEKMLGPEAYKGVLNQAQMILRAGGKAMREAAVRVNASENVGLDPDAKNFHRLFADKMAGNKRLSREVIAYLADDPKNHELPFMRKLGFTKPLTTDDIVSLITTAARRSGEFSQRRGEASTETIKFGGAARPTTNSEGQRIHPAEEGLRNFWRWFKDSVAVDDQGRPLVVYHGTPEASGISEFNMNGGAAYFTSSRKVADDYTANRGVWRSQPTGVVTDAYLALQNPLVIDALGKRNDNIPVPWQAWSPKVFGNLPENAVNMGKLVEYAKANGHDGVVVSNVVDTADIADKRKSDVFVAFRPEQIKSATGNQGSYDPSDTDIRRSAKAPEWYSQMSRVLATKLPNSGTPESMLAMIEGYKDFKAEELDYSGIREFLAQQTGKVTKQEILDELALNAVKVETVTLRENEGAKFTEYQLPGEKTNYREVLLTLPEKVRAEKEALHDEVDREYRRNGNSDRYNELVRQLRDATEAVRSGTFRSTHFPDVANPVAHLRMNDRTDADGRRVLFVEEVQSDFGQSMRKSKLEVVRQVKADFESIVKRMKDAGVLTVECD